MTPHANPGPPGALLYTAASTGTLRGGTPVTTMSITVAQNADSRCWKRVRRLRPATLH